MKLEPVDLLQVIPGFALYRLKLRIENRELAPRHRRRAELRHGSCGGPLRDVPGSRILGLLSER
jgi:hypothetical protein